jgi:hypothetical protein
VNIAIQLAADTWRHLKNLGVLPDESTDESTICNGACTRCPNACVPTVVVRLERKKDG